MTADEIAHDITLLANQAATSGDAEDGPGLILLSADTWCRPGFHLQTEHTTALRGIRHRNVRVRISSQFEDRVLSRREARLQGSEDFEDLEPVEGPPA